MANFLENRFAATVPVPHTVVEVYLVRDNVRQYYKLDVADLSELLRRACNTWSDIPPDVLTLSDAFVRLFPVAELKK